MFRVLDWLGSVLHLQASRRYLLLGVCICRYRVFLGNGRYFVSSDVGGGKMQWYAFHKEAAGGKDEPNKQKERLLTIFGDWADAVTDLIRATPEADVLRRDIYDRCRWAQHGVMHT